jgi:23S rRNA pseudouridine1911/1915/1917 synthase
VSSRAPFKFIVGADEEGERLDRFLGRRLPGVSRGALVRVIGRGKVLVDGGRCAKGERLRGGQEVVVAAAATDEAPVPQPELPLRVIAVRPHLVVVNKPPGMPCHPLVPGETETVANAVVALFPECLKASPQAREGGLVHRLDWSTSGLLVAARSREAYGQLRGLFGQGQVEKEYLALVAGQVTGPGQVDRPVEAAPGDHSRVRVVLTRDDRGQPALTEYHPLEMLGDTTLLRVRSTTGRRHQVRVHLAHVGHPLVGDDLYGGPALPGVEGAFLHASAIKIAGETFEAALPAERRAILAELEYPGDEG